MERKRQQRQLRNAQELLFLSRSSENTDVRGQLAGLSCQHSLVLLLQLRGKRLSEGAREYLELKHLLADLADPSIATDGQIAEIERLTDQLFELNEVSAALIEDAIGLAERVLGLCEQEITSNARGLQ